MTYKTENFLAKNRDFVVAEHQTLLGASVHEFVRALFPPEDASADGAKGAGGRAALSSYTFSSVGSRFKVGQCSGWQSACRTRNVRVRVRQ